MATEQDVQVPVDELARKRAELAETLDRLKDHRRAEVYRGWSQTLLNHMRVTAERLLAEAEELLNAIGDAEKALKREDELAGRGVC